MSLPILVPPVGSIGYHEDVNLNRFDMSPMPKPGGSAGEYEEQLAQWLLENTFFREFVFRCPPGKAGKGELADAVVLYEQTLLMVQVKAQTSTKDPRDWFAKNASRALAQVSYTHRMLYDRHVRVLEGRHRDKAVQFDPDRFPDRMALVLIHQTQQEPFDPAELLTELVGKEYPVHLMSLSDFIEVSRRFDTAGDFLAYLELRSMVEPKPMHSEESVATAIATHLPSVLTTLDRTLDPDIVSQSVDIFRSKVDGRLCASDEWKYGLLIDDVIAHLRDLDLSLPWSTASHASDSREVAARLGLLTRERRIADGRQLYDMVSAGKTNWFHRVLRRRGLCLVYLVSEENRENAARLLTFLMQAAKTWFEVEEVVGISTNTMRRDQPGRAYDVALLDTDVPDAVADKIRSRPNPFA